MQIPVWLMWLFATMLAIMPAACTLMIARSVDKVRPKKRSAKPLEYNPYAACEGVRDYDIEEVELRFIAYVIAQEQMRQMWGKDIDSIV